MWFQRLTLMTLVLCAMAAPAQSQKGVYLSLDEFRVRAFADSAVAWQTLWISGPQREQVEAILQRRFASLRVRYLGAGERTAWVFEEIGKELPITIGVVVDAGQVRETVVLEYRESRGGEIRHPFFTRQFKGLSLSAEPDRSLDGDIDGITGATLSVNAMKKIVRLALYCHELTPFSQSNAESELTTAH